jgi:hypothetical protein
MLAIKINVEEGNKYYFKYKVPRKYRYPDQLLSRIIEKKGDNNGVLLKKNCRQIKT